MPYLIRNVFKENRIAFRFKSKYYLLNDYLKIILSHLLAFFLEPNYYVMFDFKKILKIERKNRKNIKEFFYILNFIEKFEKKLIRIIIC